MLKWGIKERKGGVFMPYKIIICDDVDSDSAYLRSLVTNWAASRNVQAEITAYTSAEAFLFAYADDKSCDILLLDIEMGDLNGVELARKIRKSDKEVQIIFVTGFSDYIADGYDVEALQYLMKPVSQEKLFISLDRAVEKLKKNSAVLLLELPDGMVRIPLYEIRYLEVRANYVTVHTDAAVSVKSTLAALEEKLDDSFFRVGRSFIVNLRYIRKVTKSEVFLDGNISVPLSRGFYEPLNRAIIGM